MSIPILKTSPFFSSNLYSTDFDDYSIKQAIRHEQYEQTRKAFCTFREKHLAPGDSCNLETLGSILTERGKSEVIEHQVTSVSDHLCINIDGIEFDIEKPLFAKRRNPYLSIKIASIGLIHHIH
jgi:hypothetical protein